MEITIILIIVIVINLISIGLNFHGFRKYNKLINEIIKDQTYPTYYKDVLIYYRLPGESLEHVKKAWLAVNDDLEYIWTRSDNEQIIPDEWVTKWEYIK